LALASGGTGGHGGVGCLCWLLEQRFTAERKELAVAILDMGVAGWWSCLRLMVELLMEKLTVRWLMDVEVEVVAAEKKKNNNCRKN